MNQSIEEVHHDDENGNPAGGETKGTGIFIQWQNGPLGRGEERKEPNGAFVEGVIAAAIGRIRYYQQSKFKCEDNALALFHLEKALTYLNRRTTEREVRQVEGTHAS